MIIFQYKETQYKKIFIHQVNLKKKYKNKKRIMNLIKSAYTLGYLTTLVSQGISWGLFT